MVSNVISFQKENNCIKEILTETQKMAVHNGLQGKNALHLRLLAEEVCSMIDVLVQSFEGDFWLEEEQGTFSLCLKLYTDSMNLELKEELIEASSSGKNASARGMIGRIRDVVHNLAMMNEGNTLNMYEYDVDYTNLSYSSAWLFSRFKTDLENDPEPVIWDELEKSILTKLASEIVVGVKGKNIEIIVKKIFEKENTK